jgi:cobyrinic acid a,c-diamide synthase
VLLDRVDAGSHQARLAIEIETHWEVPVLGMLEPLAELRAQLNDVTRPGRPSEEVAHRLGDEFLRRGEPERIAEIAQRHWRSAPARPESSATAGPGSSSESVELPVAGEPCGVPASAARPIHPIADVTVALAYDEALNCYFPDTLDLLELHGATVIDFSPLHDDRLPEADVVYLGCGHPERFARALSDNDCMRLALREHVRRGGRIYAEGGGMAYLCHQLEAEDGSLHRMVGVLPAVARLSREASEPLAVSATLAEGCWLGPPGERLRGYLSDCWRIEPTGRFHAALAEPERQRDVIQCCHVIGSRIHLDFAAQANLLSGFFHPHVAASDTFDPWKGEE